MKIRITFLCLLAVSTAIVASAQVVEYDDMYFNSKDRMKVLASKPLTLKNITTEHEVATAINPTDSYSARNVNPEYISQSTVNPSGSAQPATYFIPDYSPTAINQNLKSNSSSSWNNCNCASYGNNPYYGMTPGYGSPYSSYYPSMSSMYGGYGYSPYGSGYNGFNSLYNSGWSSFLTLGFGMGMGGYPYGGSSFGMGMGYGGSPYGYGMNPYSGMGMGMMGYNYYPKTVVIINDNNRNNNVVYGTRPSRSSDINNTVTSYSRGSVAVADSQGRMRSSGSNGRISDDGSNNSYYQRGWRTNPDTNSGARSTWNSSGRTGVDGNSNNHMNNSSFFDNNGSRSSNWGGSSNNFSGGGGSRSGGGSVGGGSSSGARRGRD